MTLSEFCNPLTDGTNVLVLSSETGEKLAEYNGRENIPLELNEMTVVKVYLQGKCLVVEVE